MSLMTISEITLSIILSQTGKFDIGLNWSSRSVGVTFATGVIISNLYLFGQEPVLRQVFIISVNGIQKISENLFIPSPAAEDLVSLTTLSSSDILDYRKMF